MHIWSQTQAKLTFTNEGVSSANVNSPVSHLTYLFAKGWMMYFNFFLTYNVKRLNTQLLILFLNSVTTCNYIIKVVLKFENLIVMIHYLIESHFCIGASDVVDKVG